MKKPHIRAILSTLLIIIFLILATTGTVLYFGKTGMILGFSRQFLRNVHFCAAIIISALVLAHFILNFRLYTAEFRKLVKRGDIMDDDK